MNKNKNKVLNFIGLACSVLLMAGGNAAYAKKKASEKKSDSYVFSRSEVYGYSDAFPAKSYLNLLVGPAPKQGDFAFARTRVELGFGFNNFEISAIHRNDYNITFTPDAADFTYRRKNNVRVEPGNDFVVDVRANQYQVSGAKLAYKMPLHEKFTLRLAYSHLVSTEVVSGRIGQMPDGEGGTVSISIEQLGNRRFERLEGLLYADYYYTDDPLFERQIDEPAGNGYAIDVGFEWKVSEHFRIVGQVDDLAGELKWDGIGRTTATATSAIREINDEGSVDILPNFEGTETFADYSQSLTRRERLSFNYDLHGSRWHLAYDWVRYPEIELHNFAVAYEWTKDWSFEFAYEPNTSGKSFGLNTPVGQMYFLFDTLDFDKARTIGFGWSFSVMF